MPDLDLEALFASKVKQAARGTTVRSMEPPALATSFVKASKVGTAKPKEDGALATIIYPSDKEVNARHQKVHGRKVTFGYTQNAVSDAFPAGYGERTAQALRREDNTYQLKSSFTSACTAFSRLRARVEAREGNIESITSVFAKMWGLDESEADQLPALHVVGSEHTRMAAMEDRTYHSLATHPSVSGGYRVDMASLAPDALGSDIPLNWPRIRTSLKAIASVQLILDEDMERLIRQCTQREEFAFSMNLTKLSQPRYERTTEWETLFVRLMSSGFNLKGTYAESFMRPILKESQQLLLESREDLHFSQTVEDVAKTVKRESKRELNSSTAVMHMYDHDRELRYLQLEEEYAEFVDSELSREFDVPLLKVTRDSLYRGFEKKQLGKDDLPDMRSHGPERSRLSRDEFRAAGITGTYSAIGALNMAIYLTVGQSSVCVPCYELLRLVKDPNPGSPGRVIDRLRAPNLYDKARRLGDKIFGASFVQTFESILTNLSVHDAKTEIGIRNSIWNYMYARTHRGGIKPCPVHGSWRDLILYLLDAPEGWLLYFWARISIGKLHNLVNGKILAPIPAGMDTTLPNLIRMSVNERKKKWTAFYAAKNISIAKDREVIEEARRRILEQRQKYKDKHGTAQYIPPHLRSQTDLQEEYDEQFKQARKRGYTYEQYCNMVEAQVKAHVLSKVEISTFANKIAVGLSDDSVRELMIEQYQARWYSLDRRVRRAKLLGKPFRLGPYSFDEHPWGEYRQDYPKSTSEMLIWLGELDMRAWTLEPNYLWMKLQKSLREMWVDTAKEIDQILAWAYDTVECQMDEQSQLLMDARLKSALSILTDVEPIILPSQGFRPTQELPIRVRAPIQENRIIEQEGKAMIKPSLLESTSISDDELDDTGDVDMAFDDTEDLMEQDQQLYLSYNQIWSLLSLPEASEGQKKVAFGLSVSVDLDSPHLNEMIGPLVLPEEANDVKRKWKSRMVGIMHRLGDPTPVVHADDM